MATLVFSTVGTLLGGPVGGAIGALVGQSFDQQILGPQGPRLGDFKVQGSDYGSPIPRVYGRMRVAGSIVWATDLEPSGETSGAKGQSAAVTSYIVSLAVALSSRPAGAIGRIWADGKLLRGAGGDFKVSTTFRFYNGSEDQEVDPLIASAEGIGMTPAYRGTALAVFENLELAEYGNRIPFLTFELIADAQLPAVGAILADASGGAIEADGDEQVTGYAAYGSSIRAAAAPLIDAHAIRLFDDGMVLRPAAAPAMSAEERDFGCSAEADRAPRLERELAPTRSLPRSLRLTYYEPERDFQTGEARASAGEQGGPEEKREIAAAIDAGRAKSLAHRMIARSWTERDRLKLRLPPRLIAAEPGTLFELPLSPTAWIAERVTVEGFAVIADLTPLWEPNAALAADPGRALPSPDLVAGPATLALVELSSVPSGGSTDGPVLMLAASSASPAWRSQAAVVSAGGRDYRTATPRVKSVLGVAETALGNGQPFLRDDASGLTVALVDPDQWLESRDPHAIVSGDNLAILGSEMIQFATAEPLGAGRFRLGGLMRGRGGTEWAMTGHSAGEPFVALDPQRLTRIDLPASAISAAAVASVVGTGPQPVSPAITVGGSGQKPLSPTRLAATPEGDSLFLTWARRSRGGLSWLDEMDAPLEEAREAYQVTITGSALPLTIETAAAQLTLSAAEVALLGSGPATVSVQQIGDRGPSRAASLAINLP